jgi:hypothetical protein
MRKPYEGMKCGCNDSRRVDDYRMSRIYDILYAAQEIGGANLKQAMWEALPTSDRGDFNYGLWRYTKGA